MKDEEKKMVSVCVSVALWRNLKAKATLGGWKVGELLERAIELEIADIEEKERQEEKNGER